MSEFIDIADLEVRAVYELHARNLRCGVWTGDTWIGLREKFDRVMLDECETPGRSAHATHKIGEIDDTIELRAYMPSICQVCGERVDFDMSRGSTWQERWQHLSGPSDHDARSVAPQNEPLRAVLKRYEETMS